MILCSFDLVQFRFEILWGFFPFRIDIIKHRSVLIFLITNNNLALVYLIKFDKINSVNDSVVIWDFPVLHLNSNLQNVHLFSINWWEFKMSLHFWVSTGNHLFVKFWTQPKSSILDHAMNWQGMNRYALIFLVHHTALYKTLLKNSKMKKKIPSNE